MSLYPEIAPHHTARLEVSEGHSLYVEESGNPAGIPVVVLHGGPGDGCSEKSRQRFNPEKYRIICFDQRGAGRSTPQGGLAGNTTQHLVEDIEAVRACFNVESWVVYGSSWGSALGLAYAESYPERVKALVLGSIFLGTRRELEWMAHPEGAARFFPQEYGAVVELLGNPPPEEMVSTLYLAFTGGNKEFAARIAYAWALFEGMCLDAAPNRAELETYLQTAQNLVAHAALQYHYFVNGCFLEEGQLLENAHRIAHIPTHILHGALDMICPPESAWRLHAALPGSRLEVVPLCGHRANADMEELRVRILNALAAQLAANPSA